MQLDLMLKIDCNGKSEVVVAYLDANEEEQTIGLHSKNKAQAGTSKIRCNRQVYDGEKDTEISLHICLFHVY